MKVLDMFSLKGKTAVVTGGAGLYGRQVVRGMAEAGAKVFIASRNIEPLKKVAGALNDEGCDVTALRYDQADRDSIISLKDEIASISGRIDILVNNAVYRSPAGMELSKEELIKNLDINAAGLFDMCKIFGDYMKGKKSGCIINVGSIYGMVGYDLWLYENMPFDGVSPAYYFNKGGMLNLTRYMAGYYGKFNIRVNCVSPGGYAGEKTAVEFIERYSKKTFLNKMADDTDLMGVIVFLSSDASKYITGANIAVDGGLTAK